MIFEEAIYINGSSRKMYSIEEVTYLRKNNVLEFAKIKEHLFCPECELPRLSHNLCTTKCSYFSTHNGEEHRYDCPCQAEKASHKQLEFLQSNEDELERLNKRLKDTILFTVMSKNPKSNPFIIHDDAKDPSITPSYNKYSNAKKYYIPRKRLTNGVSEEDTETLKIFYGKVKLVCKEYYTGYKLYLFNPFNDSQPMICSLYVSKKVYRHLDIPVGVKSNCVIAFFAELKLNRSKDKLYYNGVLTDSRKMAYVFFPESNAAF